MDIYHLLIICTDGESVCWIKGHGSRSAWHLNTPNPKTFRLQWHKIVFWLLISALIIIVYPNPLLYSALLTMHCTKITLHLPLAVENSSSESLIWSDLICLQLKGWRPTPCLPYCVLISLLWSSSPIMVPPCCTPRLVSPLPNRGEGFGIPKTVSRMLPIKLGLMRGSIWKCYYRDRRTIADERILSISSLWPVHYLTLVDFPRVSIIFTNFNSH